MCNAIEYSPAAMDCENVFGMQYFSCHNGFFSFNMYKHTYRPWSVHYMEKDWKLGFNIAIDEEVNYVDYNSHRKALHAGSHSQHLGRVSLRVRIGRRGRGKRIYTVVFTPPPQE